MHVVSETAARQSVDAAAALGAIADVFIALHRGEATSYPVVREALGPSGAVYGIKSGEDRSTGLLGLKSGGYWPANTARGLENHQSTVVLFDPETGCPTALVAAGYLTAIRTAAASALAARELARSESRTLAVLGAGAQAPYQIAAIRAVLPIEEVMICNRTAARAEALAASIADARPARINEALERADVIVTATPSKAALFEGSLVRPGTHISAMGADTAGKQELPASLLARAAVFVDVPEQAFTIGECRHAGFGPEGLAGTLGALLAGEAAGRSGHDEITVFDGTGTALQDLAIAALALDRAKAQNLAVEIDV